MSFEIGQTAGSYELVGVQDNSRTGVSYKVRNLLADRYEILRILPKEASGNQEQVERFLREMKVHARLSHPNIVAFYNASEIEGQLVMTSEYFEGETLEKRLESGAMTPKEAVSAMAQVLSALNHAHENGITHREVSPANILVGPDGTVKLTGFGLAKSANDPELTQAGTVMGWLEYMAPEQVKGAIDLDGRADIYSAGAVLYEMIAGQVPFVCKSQFELMMSHVNAAPAPPIHLNQEIPLELSTVTLTALSKDPIHRFQTAAQFRQALIGSLAPVRASEPAIKAVPAAAARTEPAPAPAPAEAPLPPRPVENPAAMDKTVLMGLATFILVAIIFFLYLKSR